MAALALCLAGCSKNDSTPAGSSTDTPPPAAPPAGATHGATNAAPANPGNAPAAANNTDMKTTASGLQYQVLQQGTGTVTPKPTDTVSVYYTGTLLDGSVFDKTQPGQPATFGVRQVIPGWVEGLQLMHVGDKYKFVIPANLAYGPSSPTPAIPPNSTLVFEVELVSIM